MVRGHDNCITPGVLMTAVALITAATPVLAQPADRYVHAGVHDLGRQLKVGDAVFIRIPLLPFRKVADTTSSWTNHVGIVVDISGGEPVIAESRVPFSGTTSWSRFVRRSDGGRVALARLKVGLDNSEQEQLRQAARRRYGVLYDTGFNLHSRKQFCSRFVREVVYEAKGVELG